MFLNRTVAAILCTALAAMLMSGGPALAETGQPAPWQMGLQAPVTEVGRYIDWFHNVLLWIITAITIFVLALLLYAIWRFSEKRNPVPSKLTHHTGLEVAWTIIPVLILVVIAIPSFRLLKLQLDFPKADVVIKATGHAWYWSYEYPVDQGGFKFEQYMLEEPDRNARIAKGEPASELPRLLAVDNEVVVPVGKIVRVQVTAADVLHAFAIPSFGIKTDAVPGRLNETWFKAEREGLYYGQCSELCGQRHAYMPIAFRVVSEQRYAQWLTEAKQKYAAIDGGVSVAGTSAPATAR